MGFVRFLLIAILVFYALQFIVRLLFRMWIKKAQKNFQQQTGGNPSGSYGNRGGRAQNVREGDVKINTQTAPPKQVNEKIGDYVDYEEVK